jgi:hypothetical protein
MSKPFSRLLYDQDDKAKEVFIRWITSQGWQAKVNPDQYGIDVLCRSAEGVEWAVEVEVKHSWKSREFPHNSVHFAARKLKFAQDNAVFFMFNHDLSRALGVSGERFRQCKIVSKKTIYTENEQFVEVPKAACKFWDVLES